MQKDSNQLVQGQPINWQIHRYLDDILCDHYTLLEGHTLNLLESRQLVQTQCPDILLIMGRQITQFQQIWTQPQCFDQQNICTPDQIDCSYVIAFIGGAGRSYYCNDGCDQITMLFFDVLYCESFFQFLYKNTRQNETILIKLINRSYIMNASETMLNMSMKTDSKVGYTTTVKEQVEDIENKIDNFKKTVDSQRKQQNELQFQLKKLEEQARTNMSDINKEIGERVNYLSELFRTDSRGQNKQFEYLELQNSTLTNQHDKLNQMASMTASRTQDIENTVGF